MNQRVQALNEAPVRGDRRYVLYWMGTARRAGWNFALDRAVAWAEELGKPLVVLEPLRLDYPWASARFHGFVLEGMRDNAEAFGRVHYHPYVELRAGERDGLIEAFAAEACVVVADDFPAFIVPRLLEQTARGLDVLLERVDGNGLYPVRATDKAFTAAVHFRRHLQKSLTFELPRAHHAFDLPRLDRPPAAAERYPVREVELAALAIDQAVAPVAGRRGGSTAGRARLKAFMADAFARYHADRNDPDADAASGLSPWLHWGHLSAHEVFDAVCRSEGWSPSRVAPRPNASREGWWRMSEPAEAFLDELITWRELSFNGAAHLPDFDSYESLPAWARETLEQHVGDERDALYTMQQLEDARTGDPVWNAAQRQLREEGIIHNYLRMVWGKRVLAWTRSPQEALARLVHLNNKYALDGRDPNSYSGIFWVFGRYDRAWGPERPIYGKVRYMSSALTPKKLKMKAYLKRWS